MTNSVTFAVTSCFQKLWFYVNSLLTRK